jgi:glycerol-3-phosphate acyltransferase PlsY
MNPVVVIAAGYLFGSVPFAFLLARRRGVDLRTTGSGNVGASNVLRTIGVSMGVLAVTLDALKGAVAVLLAEQFGEAPDAALAAGLASVLGHVYPPWLGFRGGKGVATAGGAFAVLAPGAVAVSVVAFIIAVVATRIISVASIAAAVTLVIVTALTESSRLVVAGAMAAAVMIVCRHRGNIARVLAGTERRVGGA